MSIKRKAWINVIMLLITFGVNFLGASGFINGMSQADVSDKYNTLITPAGFTFSIWSIIYTLLLVSLILMAIKSNQSYYKKTVELISVDIWLSLIFNMLWIVSFSFEWVGISTIFIFIYLYFLTRILMKLKTINQDGQWLIPVSFGLNAGWLFIASVVNVAAFLTQIEWSGFGISDNIWTGIIIVVATALAYIVGEKIDNAAFTLPIAWAFWGIFSALQDKNVSTILLGLSIIANVVMILTAVKIFMQNNNAVFPKN